MGETGEVPQPKELTSTEVVDRSLKGLLEEITDREFVSETLKTLRNTSAIVGGALLIFGSSNFDEKMMAGGAMGLLGAAGLNALHGYFEMKTKF